jgi:ankyrin repeat protein
MNDVNHKGLTAIALAAKKGHLKITKMLKKSGADLNLTDSSGIGPLYLAILNNQEKCAEFLIENGA